MARLDAENLREKDSEMLSWLNWDLHLRHGYTIESALFLEDEEICCGPECGMNIDFDVLAVRCIVLKARSCSLCGSGV